MRTPEEIGEEVRQRIKLNTHNDYEHMAVIIAAAVSRERQHQAKLEAEVVTLKRHIDANDRYLDRLEVDNKRLLDAITTLSMKENKTAMEALAEVMPTRSELEQQLSQAEARVKEKDEEIEEIIKDLKHKQRVNEDLRREIDTLKKLMGREG